MLIKKATVFSDDGQLPDNHFPDVPFAAQMIAIHDIFPNRSFIDMWHCPDNIYLTGHFPESDLQ